MAYQLQCLRRPDESMGSRSQRNGFQAPFRLIWTDVHGFVDVFPSQGGGFTSHLFGQARHVLGRAAAGVHGRLPEPSTLQLALQPSLLRFLSALRVLCIGRGS